MRVYRRLDNEVLNGGVVLAIEVEYVGCELLDLLCAQAAQTAVAHDKVIVNLLDLFFGNIHRNYLAYNGYAQALLEGAYHDKIRKMDLSVFFLHRSGHNLHADVIIDRARSDYRIAARHVRKKVKKAADERYDLIHIKIKVGKLVPGRKRKTVYVFIPSAQLGCNEFAVIYRSFLPKVLYNTL